MIRFSVNYRVFADNEKEASQRAEAISLEQTVEIPRDVVPSGYIEDVILGRIENISYETEGQFIVTMSYSPDSVGTELPQLLNVIFGNSSIQRGLKVLSLDLGTELTKRFPGAKFGITGVRNRANRQKGGLVSAVIKPQGSSVDDLVSISYRCALAGVDIIKDDHGLTNQHMAPFKERCEGICAAVKEANAKTGGSTLYFPSIAGHSNEINSFAQFAKKTGAGGVLIMPGLFGFDVINRLARDEKFDLPIMSHPSFLGPYVLSEDTGFTHGMMFGVLQRLAGADISIFPNVGGRFGFTAAECRSIAEQCVASDGIGRAIFPSPGGGMTVDRAQEMKKMYGNDVVYLLGGSLLRYGEKIGDGIKEMRQALDQGECV